MIKIILLLSCNSVVATMFWVIIRTTQVKHVQEPGGGWVVIIVLLVLLFLGAAGAVANKLYLISRDYRWPRYKFFETFDENMKDNIDLVVHGPIRWFEDQKVDK